MNVNNPADSEMFEDLVNKIKAAGPDGAKIIIDSVPGNWCDDEPTKDCGDYSDSRQHLRDRSGSRKKESKSDNRKKAKAARKARKASR